MSILQPKFAVRLTPATFAHYITDGAWVPAKHLLFIASELAPRLLRGNAHIIVTVPPRHGKSELISVHTPSWWLDLFPHTRVMLTTYGSDLSKQFSRRVRDTILHFGGTDKAKPLDRHKMQVKLRSDTHRADDFTTTEGGGMIGVGLGGVITGKGANLLLVDDFVKNADEAESPTVQQSIWDWFVSTAYTRLEPDGNVVILATRWNVNDLIGKILAHDFGDHVNWEVINLPALADEDDPLGRERGEALWPERYDEKRLQAIQAVLGTYFFNALYQQRPVSRDDIQILVDLIKVVDDIEYSECSWVRSWDLAGSKNKGDYTVGSLVGRRGPARSSQSQIFVDSINRGQWSSAEVERQLRETAEADGVKTRIVLEQEPGSGGKSYAEHLAKSVLAGFDVTVRPTGNSSKWVRGQPLVAAIQSGRFYVRRAGWNKDLKEEFRLVPNGPHDDIFDSVATGFNFLEGNPVVSPVWGRTSSGIIVPRGEGAENSVSPSGKIITGITWGRKRPR